MLRPVLRVHVAPVAAGFADVFDQATALVVKISGNAPNAPRARDTNSAGKGSARCRGTGKRYVGGDHQQHHHDKRENRQTAGPTAGQLFE